MKYSWQRHDGDLLVILNILSIDDCPRWPSRWCQTLYESNALVRANTALWVILFSDRIKAEWILLLIDCVKYYNLLDILR